MTKVLALRSQHAPGACSATRTRSPGFRFLATRGGRPPLQPTPRDDLAIVREGARLVRVVREEGLAAALGLGRCSRASHFRSQAASARGRLAALLPRRCGPRVPLMKHPAWAEQVVVAVRLATYWNAKRNAAELRWREITLVSHGRIERLVGGDPRQPEREMIGIPGSSGAEISRSTSRAPTRRVL